MKYYIYVNGKEISEVSGTEAAYAAWRLACNLADCLSVTADLVDGETGEVIESNDWDDEDKPSDEELEEGFDPLEMGFDPYEGAYTFDC